MSTSTDTKSSYQSEVFIMKKAAIKAAQSIVRDFGELERLQVSRKGVSNFITSADIRAEDRITDELQHSGFKYNIESEERGFIKSDNNSEYTWIIDPIDGTNNFRRGIPYFCISIALTKDKCPVASVCLDPIRSNLFRASVNQGAYADGRNRIHVTSRIKLFESVVAIRSNDATLYSKLVKANSIIRRTGSVALDLSYLASGKYDAVIMDGVQWWDIAAGIVMVKEAGGFIEYSRLNNSFKLRAACTHRLFNEINNLSINYLIKSLK